jgi:hypothetical protein
MSKYLSALATLAFLSAPAFAGDNHSYIDSCPANKYECEFANTIKGTYKGSAPLAITKQDFDDREERRLQENNTRAN